MFDQSIIREACAGIKIRRGKLDELETKLQSICEHPAPVKEHQCGGEFDNHYITRFDCLDCGKIWIEEGSK